MTDTCTCTRTNVHTHYSENANRIRLPRINALGNNIRRDRVSNSFFATPMYIHPSFCFTILVRWTFLPGNSSIWAARAQAKLICKIYVKRADFSTLVSQSDQHTQSTLSITEWWDQCHMFTTFCRSSAAPAFTSSETTSVSPLPAASISGDSPSCVMTDMCSETLMTGTEGSLHTRPSLHVWGRKWYRQPSVSYVWVYNLSSGEGRTPYWTPHINIKMTCNSSEWTHDSPCPLVCKPSLWHCKKGCFVQIM